jgi:hypothetical protein
MKRSFRCLVLSLVAVAGLASPSHAQSYDAAGDYNTNLITGTNPNGVWSYGWSATSGSTLNLYTQHNAQTVGGMIWNEWLDPAHVKTNVPVVYKNTGSSVDDGNESILAGALILHGEGPNDTGGYENDYSHVLWTAPASGLYNIAATFQLRQRASNADTQILYKGVSVFNANLLSFLEGASYSNSLSFLAGDTLDFAVAQKPFIIGGNSVQLTAVISQVADTATPEPGSLALLVGLGSAGTVFALRRYKKR